MAENQTRGDRMPWAFAIGAGAGALGLFTLLAGDASKPAPWVLLGVGALLMCTGLIQRSIEKSKR